MGSLHKPEAKKSTFDDLMDEYDSIEYDSINQLDDLDIQVPVWKECNKSNVVVQQKQSLDKLRLNSSAHGSNARHPPPRSISDPLRIYFLQSGQPPASTMMDDISEKTEDFSDSTDLHLDDLGAIL